MVDRKIRPETVRRSAHVDALRLLLLLVLFFPVACLVAPPLQSYLPPNVLRPGPRTRHRRPRRDPHDRPSRRRGREGMPRRREEQSPQGRIGDGVRDDAESEEGGFGGGEIRVAGGRMAGFDASRRRGRWEWGFVGVMVVVVAVVVGCGWDAFLGEGCERFGRLKCDDRSFRRCGFLRRRGRRHLEGRESVQRKQQRLKKHGVNERREDELDGLFVEGNDADFEQIVQ
mmetsp:Transcript_9231/g.18683  ORF Transcript_9231/g.18683 Transcript_9231/m.18683 type:complete len:228 (+) Transcript_9231:1965-2648(+)